MRTTHKTMSMAVAVVLGAAVTLTGCGDDSGGDGDVAKYCELDEQFSAQEGIPSNEQLDQVVAAAPSEIKDAARTLADVLKEQGEDAFSDSEPPQEVLDAVDDLNAFEDENCDTGDSTS